MTLAEAGRELGGRVARESRLPSLAAWGRVRDYRLQGLARLANVKSYLDSRMGAAEVLEAGCQVVAVATGAHWRRDGVGRFHRSPVPGFEGAGVYTPDNLMAPDMPDMAPGPVVVFDDDHYYMAAVLAERLALAGRAVTLVTTAGMAGALGVYTEEDHFTNKRLLELGVTLHTNAAVVGFEKGQAIAGCKYTGRKAGLEAAALVTVTARTPDDALYRDLNADPDALARAGIRKLVRIGDALAPALIAHAVHSGHAFARELDSDEAERPSKRELAVI